MSFTVIDITLTEPKIDSFDNSNAIDTIGIEFPEPEAKSEPEATKYDNFIKNYNNIIHNFKKSYSTDVRNLLDIYLKDL